MTKPLRTYFTSAGKKLNINMNFQNQVSDHCVPIIVIEVSAPQSIVSSDASLSDTKPVILSVSSDSPASFVSLGFPGSLSFVEPDDSEMTSSWRRFDDFSH
jgi:hypothetical protein